MTVLSWNNLIDISCLVSSMKWTVFPQNPYVDSLIHNVMVFGDETIGDN